MEGLISIYRTLDALQRRLAFRIVASAIILIACGVFFGYVLSISHNLDAQRQTLMAELSNQNFQRGDPHAVTLRTQGTVTVNGRTYGGEEYLQPRIAIFDTEGNLIQVGALVESFLIDQRPDWAPGWLVDEPSRTWMFALVLTGWLLLIVWMELTLPFILTLIATALPALLASQYNQQQLMVALMGIGLLTFTFLMFTRLALLGLNHRSQILAVAHTVVKEASRRGIALVFIVLLLVILPLLPLILDADQPLRYRIQSYMSWSLGLTFAIAAVMTLFFSCASVAFEIRDRQIWQLMTKPVARLNYLFGKWVGVMTLNMIVVGVAGVSTFSFVQFLRHAPVDTSTQAGQLDLVAVEDEVLSARRTASPVFQLLGQDELRLRVNRMIENDAELSRLERIPTAHRNALEQQLQKSHMAGLRSIPVGGQRDYVFTGLNEARAHGSTVSLRYKFYILRDDEHQRFDAGFVFNDDPNKRWRSRFVPTLTHSVPIPASWIREDGTLKVTIVNLTPPIPGQGGAINFEDGGLEIMHKAGSFEANFIKALLTIWIKLAFLSALGVGCATFLSFPVACLLSFTVFVAGLLGPYLSQALEWYHTYEMHEVDWSNVGMVVRWAFESVTRAIAVALVFLLSSFGEYRPTQSLVEGKLIPWTEVLRGFVTLTLLWSGLAMIVGYTVLRRRQLAIYSGQG